MPDEQTSLEYWFKYRWSIGQSTALAGILEASAAKVGNVHPQADFENMQYTDFLASYLAIQPVFERSEHLTVGQLILESVTATRACVDLNTNLGTLLLLAPLAKAVIGCHNNHLAKTGRAHTTSTAPNLWRPGKGQLQAQLRLVIAELNEFDAECVYQAIRVARPGGLGIQSINDVSERPTADLVGAMRQVSGVDAVARQYANGFHEVLELWAPMLASLLRQGIRIRDAICRMQIKLLASQPDGLIVRKAGAEIAARVQQLAAAVCSAEQDSQLEVTSIDELDRFLRGDGHRRNPGTTADLIAATIFTLLNCDPQTF